MNIVKRIIKKSNESTIWKICSVEGDKFIMKKLHTSFEKCFREINFQKICSGFNITPKILDCNFEEKIFVMDYIQGCDLLEYIKKSNGVLSPIIQERINYIFKTLDNVGIFHGDTNLHNFMLCRGVLYIIDFGMSVKIDSKFIKKNRTSTPNMDLMGSALILKFKKLGVKYSSYKYILENINPRIKTIYKL